MSILSKVNSALGYVIQRAPHYIRRRVQSKISDGVYRIYNPYGELSRGDMISHCENNDQIWYYGSSEHFEISPPLTGTTPEQLQDLVGTYECPESFVCELNDVRLVGDRAIPRVKDGRFVLEEMGTESMLKSRVLNSFSRSFSNREKIQQTLASSHSKSSNYDYEIVINLVPRHGKDFNNYANFAHWILEDLPRLRAYDNYCKFTGHQPTLLIKRDPQDWMVETLNCLGFDSDDWIEWDDDHASIQNLVVPQLDYIHSIGSQFAPSNRKWVANQIKTKYNSRISNNSKNILISRQDADRRSINNFSEVKDALESFGFDSYQLEQLSLEQEVRLFSQANVIIGVHGAGLAAMIYSKNATVIEIFPPNTVLTTYYILANEMGLDYDYIVGESIEESGGKSTKNQNFTVDTREIINLIGIL